MTEYQESISQEIKSLENHIRKFKEMKDTLETFTGKVVNKRLETLLEKKGFNVSLSVYRYKDNTWEIENYERDFPYDYRGKTIEIYVDEEGRYKGENNIDIMTGQWEEVIKQHQLSMDTDYITRNDNRFIELCNQVNEFLNSLSYTERRRYDTLKADTYPLTQIRYKNDRKH